jgi:hypothetical protein
MNRNIKIFGNIFIFIILFFSVIFFLFSFSYLSLINNKVFDWFFVNQIQKYLYFNAGLRNIWQTKSDCVEFDQDLFYRPKDGVCKFQNAEFKTNITFKDGVRDNKNKSIDLSLKSPIAILGDSYTMGWGVDDNETYSSILERLAKRKVYNLGVSSYATLREIKKLINSEIYRTIDTIIIQYDNNDYLENLENKKKKYTEEDFKKLFPEKLHTYKDKLFIFFRYFKKSFRILYHEIKKIFERDKYIKKIDLNKHYIQVEKIILENLDYKNKKIIILFFNNPELTYYNFPTNNILDFIVLDMKSDLSNFFIIDDHWTVKGHKFVAKKIYNYLENN